MADEKKFDRAKNGLKPTRRFLRSGVRGEAGTALTAEQIAKLTDDDVAALDGLGLVEVTGRAPTADAGTAKAAEVK